MLRNFAINKIENDPKAFTDLIWYYEQIVCFEFESTSHISTYIDYIFENGNIIYNDDVTSESAFIEYFNKQYNTNHKTIDEIEENENIDLIRGDRIYAIIW